MGLYSRLYDDGYIPVYTMILHEHQIVVIFTVGTVPGIILAENSTVFGTIPTENIIPFIVPF